MPATSASSRTTPAATGARTGRRAPDAYGRASHGGRRARGDRRGGRRRRASSSATARRAGAALLLAAEHPERVRGAVFMSPALPITPPLPERHRHASTRSSPVRGLGEGRTATTGPRTSADYLEFFFGALLPEPHSTKQIEDAVGWGLETTPETLIATLGPPGLDAGESATCWRACAARRSSRRQRDPSSRPTAAPPSPRRPGPSSSSSAPRATARTPRHPVRFNELLRDFAARASAARPGRAAAARPRAAAARAARLLADRPRPRVARRRDRRASCARCARSSHRLARAAAGHPRARGLRRARSTRRARGWRTSRATSPPSRASTSSTSSRRGGGWTRSCSRTSWSSATSRAPEPLRPLDRRRGLGARLLPPREPVAQDRAVRLPHRLRRLAADGEGGERGGAPDRRLQRRDDRAHRALPTCATARSSSARPTTSSPHGFGHGLPAIRPWVEEHFAFSGYVLGPRRRRAADRDALRAELGSAPESGSASSRSAARASATGCSRRVVAAYPAARGACPACGWSPSAARASTPTRSAADGVEVLGYVHRLSPAPRGVRRRGRPGRPEHLHGARGGEAAVPLPAAAPPLRAEPARPPPPRALRGGAAMDFATRHPDALAAAIGDALGGRSEPAGGGARRRRAGRGAHRRRALTRHPDRHRRTSRHGEPERVRLP